MRDGPRDAAETIHEWNPGGVGNAAGADIATPSSTWNPNGMGNIDEYDEGRPHVAIDDPADEPSPPGPENPTI